MFLTIGSPINAGRFNKHRQPTGLTTCIYYLIWPPHILPTIAKGQLVTANHFNIAKPLPQGSPCSTELKYSSFFFTPQVVHIAGPIL